MPISADTPNDSFSFLQKNLPKKTAVVSLKIKQIHLIAHSLRRHIMAELPL